MSEELQHFGVRGMRWGVRKDNKQTSIRTRSGRLDTFGKNGHNILYVTGISGSGKSTLALKLANKLGAEPIHLDRYYDGRSKEKTQFYKFLKDNGVDLRKVYKNNKLNYEESDKIFPLLKKYSKNHKLIVEGVQLLDETMALDIKKTLAKEPVISTQTSAKVSFNRAVERDQAVMDYSNFIKAKKKQEILDNQILLDVEDKLQHFGVRGMRWGVRKSRSSSLGSRVKKAFGKSGSKKVDKKQSDLAKAVSTNKKRPQDMTDEELDAHYNRTLAISKLKKAASNSSLDDMARAEARKAYRNKDAMTSDDLKKEADRLDKRSNQLTSLRPSTNKKPGIVYKTGVGLLKDVVVSDKNVEKILNVTLKKTNVKLDERVVKAVGKILKSTGNTMIDKATNKAYATVIDRTAKNQYVVVDYKKKKEDEDG